MSDPSAVSAFIKSWRPAWLAMLGAGDRPGAVHLDGVLVPTHWRGQGWGTKAVDWVLSTWAGDRIVGHVQPFGYNGLRRAALRAWYRRRGFRVHRSGLIVRPEAPAHECSHS